MNAMLPVLCLVLIYIVGLVCTQITTYRRDGKLKSLKDHFMHTAKTAGFMFRSWFGWIPPTNNAENVDGEFLTVTQVVADRCLLSACERMKEQGMVYPQHYTFRLFDCDNFAHAMKHYFDVAVCNLYEGMEKGIPTRAFPYTKENGDEHCVFEVLIEGVPRFFEPYPNHFKELHLTDAEIQSYEPPLYG